MSAFNKSDEVSASELERIQIRNRRVQEADTGPGMFEGFTQLWKTPVSGGATAVAGFEGLFNLPAKANEVYAGIAYNLTPGAYGENAEEAGQLYQDRMRWSSEWEKENRAWAAEYQRQADAYYEGEQGSATQLVRGAAEMIPRAIFGNKVGGAFGGAVAVGAPEGGMTETRLTDQGVAPEVAAQAGDVTAVTMGAFAAFPAARLSNSLLADFGLVAGANAIMGATQRKAMNEILKDTPEVAAQYQALDPASIATDVLLTVPFWGLARMSGESPQARRELVDQALTVKANEQANTTQGYAPATPKDVAAVRRNKVSGIEALLNDQPMPDPEPVNAVEVPEALAEQKAFADSIAEAIRSGDIDGIRLFEDAPAVDTQQAGDAFDQRAAAVAGRIDGAISRAKGEPLYAAVEYVESRGKVDAVSPKGAIGPMQTMPGTLRDPGYGVRPAKDGSVAELRRVGRDYLDAMTAKYGLEGGLAAYNWGPGNWENALKAAGGDVQKALASAPAETRAYVPRVLARIPGAADTFANGIPKNLPEVEADVREINSSLSRFSQAGADGTAQPHRGVRPIDQGSLPDQLASALRAADEALGIQTTVVRNLSPEVRDFHGTTLGDGRIYLNENSAHPVVTVAMHEFGHNLETRFPDLYEPLRAEVERQAKDGGLAFFKYDTKQTNDALALRELTNNAMGDALSDPQFIRRMADENPTVFQKFAEKVIKYLDDLMVKVGLKDYGSDRYLTDVATFRDMLATTLNEYAARTQGFDERAQVLAYGQEIGWDQVGGQMIAVDGMAEGVKGQGGGLQVTGRTKWIPKLARNGMGRSDFWTNRPDGITEATARKALAKFADGKKLGAAEQRFIDYAKKAAKADEADRQAAFSEYMAAEAARRSANEVFFSDKLDDGFDVPPDASPEEAAVFGMARANPKAKVNFGADVDGNPITTMAEAVRTIQEQKIQDVNRAKRFGQVVERVIAGKPLSDAEAKVSDTIAAKYRDLEKSGDKAFLEMAKFERIQYAAEMAGKEAEILAAKAAQRRAANLIAQQSNVNRILARAPQLKGKKYQVTEAVFERYSQIASRIQGEQHAARADMIGALEATAPRFLGMMRNTKAMQDFAREVLGQNSGNKDAAAAAKAYLDVIEKMRLKANSLGMNIGKLSYGWLPHQWDQGMIAHGGRTLAQRAADKAAGRKFTTADARAEYVKDMLEHTDLSILRNEDGTVMDMEDATAFYEAAFDTLFTDGLNKQGQAGPGTRASKYDGNHRVIHFKNADSYMAMMDKYGGGRDLMEAIMGHLDSMAKDIAMLDELGANPRQTAELLKMTAEAADNARGVYSDGATLDMVFDTINGEISTPVNAAIAKVGQGMRNLTTAVALQGVMISSIGDAPVQSLVMKSYGLDLGQGLKTTLQSFGGNTAKEAARLGIVTDYLSNEMALWGGDSVSMAGWTGRLAETTMRLTGVNRWTHSMRRGAELNLAMGITDWISTDFAKLSAKTRENFAQAGVTEADWAVWQKAKPSQFKGVDILDFRDIQKVDDPNAYRASMRYLGMLDDFGKLAVYAPDVRARAALTQGTKSGTIGGELIRNMTLFKSFALGMPLRHLRRVRQMDAKGRAAYGAVYIVGLTAFGALALQLKQMANGKDPLDMTEGKFWMSAVAQGGGLGILFDLIYGGIDSEGRSGRQNWRALSSPVFSKVMDVTELATEGGYALAGSARHERQFRQHLARFVSDNTPFTKIWWYKEAVNQLVGHEMRETISPGYIQKERARAAKYGESFYIKPGGNVRAPDFEKAVGE